MLNRCGVKPAVVLGRDGEKASAEQKEDRTTRASCALNTQLSTINRFALLAISREQGQLEADNPPSFWNFNEWS
jgi:hypothetical protein